jgi:hypothetical protein
VEGYATAARIPGSRYRLQSESYPCLQQTAHGDLRVRRPSADVCQEVFEDRELIMSHDAKASEGPYESETRTTSRAIQDAH